MEELIFKTMAEIAVPSVICFWLLFKHTKALEENTKATQNQANAINNLVNQYARMHDDIKEIKANVNNIICQGGIHFDRSQH